MNFPEKCRKNTYVGYDENGKPKYVVLCDAESGKKAIQKVIPLSEDVDTIILPKLVEDTAFSMPVETSNMAQEYYSKDKACNYAKGTVYIDKKCFEGIKNLTVIVPFKNSIRIVDDAFDKDAKVEFIIPEGYTMSSVTREYGTRYKGYYDWVVLADEKLKGEINWNSRYMPEVYTVKEYTSTSLRSAQLSVSNMCFEKYKAEIDGEKYPPDKKSIEMMSMSEFGEYYAHEHDVM